MTAPKCTTSTLVLADRFSVQVTPDPTGNELQVSLRAQVREGGTARGTLEAFFSRRFVALTTPIRLPCAGTGVWKQAVDDYILELGRFTGQKGRRFDVAPAVHQYLEDQVQSPMEESARPIATPERFEAHFLERVQKFDGTFDTKKFRRTMTEAIAKALRPLVEKHRHLIKPVQGQKISEADYHRLVAAEKLAIAWLPEQSSVRRQLGEILYSIAGRRIISTPD